MNQKRTAVLLAVLAAALYALNAPLSKLLIKEVAPMTMAGLLYLGAGVGMGIILTAKKLRKIKSDEQWLEKKDLPYTAAMVILDIAAPILLMFGISKTSSANVSLLNNFEIVATSLFAFLIFKENVSKKLWTAILLVTAASIILGFEGSGSFTFNEGSVLVLCACICWGIENNCTRSISGKSSQEIVLIKGFFSGLGSLIAAFITGENLPVLVYIPAVMALGFVAYGLSINFYIMAQKHIGAAKTSAFYSVAPFIGVGFSFLILGERPDIKFYIALAIMITSTFIMVNDTLGNNR